MASADLPGHLRRLKIKCKNDTMGLMNNHVRLKTEK